MPSTFNQGIAGVLCVLTAGGVSTVLHSLGLAFAWSFMYYMCSVPHSQLQANPCDVALFSPMMQVLQIEEGPSLRVASETFNVRLEELSIIDIAFLAPSSSSGAGSGAGSSAAAAAAANPVLALLYEDNKQARHVKTYTLNLKTKVIWEDRRWMHVESIAVVHNARALGLNEKSLARQHDSDMHASCMPCWHLPVR